MLQKPKIKTCKNPECNKKFTAYGTKKFCSSSCCAIYHQHFKKKKKSVYKKHWILVPCSPEDPDPEKMDFAEENEAPEFYKWQEVKTENESNTTCK